MPAIAILRTAKRARKNKKANPKIQNPRKNQKRGWNKPSRPKLPPRNRWQPSPKRRAAGRQAANAAAKRLPPSRKQNRSNMLSPGRNPRKDRIERNSLRRSMAIVLQDTHLFTGTVRENIRFGRLSATDDEVVAAARLTAAHSFIKRLPQGYDTLLENDGANLSQGQRQLLNIARAAVADPAILLLDEATSNIDTRSEILIQRGLDQLMQGRTSLIIAHRLSTIRNADTILVLEHGEIIEQGSHQELLALKGKYYSLNEEQFK